MYNVMQSTYSSTPERSGPVTAGWYAVSGAGIGAYQWSAWWPIEPTEHDIPRSQARGRESSKRAAVKAAEHAIANNGFSGRAVEVNKSFANPDKLRQSGNDEESDVIYDEAMEDAATKRQATSRNAKGARAVAEAADVQDIPKRSTYRERVDGGAYWIAVMVAQGLGAPPPDFKTYGFTEAPPTPEWWRDPAAPQHGEAGNNVANGDDVSALTRTVLAKELATLGLLEGATLTEVRRAYRTKVKVAHPDRGGSNAECVRINAAYEIVLRLMSTT